VKDVERPPNIGIIGGLTISVKDVEVFLKAKIPRITFSVEDVERPFKEDGSFLNHLLSENHSLQPFLQNVLQTKEDWIPDAKTNRS